MKLRLETLFLTAIVLAAALFMRPHAVATINAFMGAPYYRGRDDLPYAALMCNVYSGSEYLEAMLDILKEENVHATFFIGGLWAEENAPLIRRIYEEGHEIGNHGTLHKQHSRLSLNENMDEIKRCEQLVAEACGVRTLLFAPPSGDYSQVTLEAADRLGYATIMWTADTIDWRDQDPVLLIERIDNKMCPGAFVLTHPTEATVQALRGILHTALSRGIEWRTVSELIQMD